jgi:hypothetical protein
MVKEVTQSDIDKELEEWAKTNNYKLSTGPAQQEAEDTIQSYRNLLVAKHNAENAPAELKNAKDAYLRQKFGEGYDEKVKEENVKEAEELAVKYKDAHIQRVENANKAFTMYSAVASFASKSVDDYVTSVELHVNDLQESSSAANFQSTNNRRTYYLNKERETVEWWDTFLTMLIIAVSLVYAYHFFFINKKYKSVLLWFGLLVLLLVSWLLPMVVNWVIHIPRAVNVYTSWAQTESPEWHGVDM